VSLENLTVMRLIDNNGNEREATAHEVMDDLRALEDLRHATRRMLRALDRTMRLRYWSDTETITWAISRSNWSVLVAARYRALVEELLGGKP
jgi:hypothetical protein